MRTNPGTPFTEEGFASVVADLRSIFLLVGGGSNDLNNASTDVTQDATSAGENANNAFKLRNVNISTTAPTDLQLLNYVKSRSQWEPVSLSGITTTSSGTTALLAANNLSDVTNATTARNNLSLGTSDGPTFATLTISSGATMTGALSCSSGVSISKDLTVSSGARFNGGIRTPPTIQSSDYAATVADYLIIVSGTSTVTLPTVTGSNSGRSYAIGAYPGATVTVSAFSASETIRGATGVSLTAGRVHTFFSDGISMWLEGRSA
jgi:hypothetical protein